VYDLQEKQEEKHKEMIKVNEEVKNELFKAIGDVKLMVFK